MAGIPGEPGLAATRSTPKRLALVAMAVLTGLALAVGIAPTGNVSAAQPSAAVTTGAAPDPAMTLWYDEPAKSWANESLPIGNGALGANVFGGVGTELVQFNEKTLWTGGPGSEQGYDFGNWRTPRPGALKEVQDRIDANQRVDANWVVQKLGQSKKGYGSYQIFGDLRLTQSHGEDATGYRRWLDVSKALTGVQYTVDGATQSREYFASAADDVVVAHLGADKPGSVGFTASLAAPDNRSQQITAEDGRITFAGRLTDNQMRYESQIQVINQGGTRTDNPDGSVTVSGADAVTLVLAAGTDYSPKYPVYRTGTDPHGAVTQTVDAAVAKGYQALHAAHVADYTHLFDRVKLQLGGSMPAMPTDDLLQAYRDGTASRAERNALETLYFQFGRYLLVSSSRAGSLPANLQGVWNNSVNPPWSANYHVNINTQMNYWPAEVTNLSETTLPLFDYVDSMVAPGEVTAKQMFGSRGWVVNNETNVFGFTGVHDYPYSFWMPDAAAWLAQHYFEHYQFTRDKQFLRTRVYPMLKSLSQFWIDSLVVDPRDGKLVVSPSFSPEQGEFSAGASISQEIVGDLFRNTAETLRILGEKKTAFSAELRDTMADLDPGLRIGSWGQLQEWKEDWDDPNNQHRHVSHLFALYPGHQISPATTPAYAKAAKVSLTARGDGGEGWSKAWKISFWARLLDGDHAHTMLSELLAKSTLDNLWDTLNTVDSDPLFQIDGNFGGTAGVAEMLLQSQNGTIDVLPALPPQWRTGSVDGLRARGGYTVGASWEQGAPREIRVVADHDGPVGVRNKMITEGPVDVLDGNGGRLSYRIDGGVLRANLQAGQTLRIVAQGTLSLDVSDAVAEPGEHVTADVTLAAHGTAVPKTTVTLKAPDGWEVQPTSVVTPPLEPGEEHTARFTLLIPKGTKDGRYDVSAVATGKRWSLTADRRISVRRFNAAVGSTATQSTTAYGGVASRAVDGDTNGAWGGNSVTHTDAEVQPWWQTDLGTTYSTIDQVAVWNRGDCCSDRLSDYYVLVSDEPFVSGSLQEVLAQPGVWAVRKQEIAGKPTLIDVGRSGRYVRVQLAGAVATNLSLAELQVFPAPTATGKAN